MGFVADYDAKDNILRITFEGNLTDEVALMCSQALRKSLASESPFNVIIDLTGVTKYDVSPEFIGRIAMGRPSQSPSVRVLVIVAPKDYAYGMSRMFQQLSESNRPNQSVVRSMEDAYRVLGLNSPEFMPLKSVEGEGSSGEQPPRLP